MQKENTLWHQFNTKHPKRQNFPTDLIPSYFILLRPYYPIILQPYYPITILLLNHIIALCSNSWITGMGAYCTIPKPFAL